MELSLRFVEELALLLALAAVTAFALSRLHLPPVLGYLLAGLVVGPGGTGWIREVELVRVLGDLGVVLIMFGLGLDFEIRRLRRTAAFSIAAGVSSVLLTLVAANGLLLLLGFRPLEALFVASALSICGTAVNLKILSDLGHLKREYGPGIAAAIVVTDLAAVLLLTVLSGVALGGGLEPRAIGLALLKAAAFLVLAPALGFALVPRLLDAVARRTRSREALLVTTLALCFGLAVVSQRLGFSLALGAFVMGVVVSQARVHHPVEEGVKPLEQVLGTLFFFSVGLSVQAASAVPHIGLVAMLVGLVVVTKLASVSISAYLSGQTGLASVTTGWGLVPVGEFSFVIVNEGVRFGVLPPDFMAVAVMVALATSAVAVAGLLTARVTIETLTDRMPAGILNLLTLLQLRTAGSLAVPGLSEITRGLRPQAPPRGPDQPPRRDAIRGEAQDIGINAAVVVAVTLGLLGAAGFLQQWMPRGLDARIGLGAAAVILCAPSVVFIFRSAAGIARLSSEALAERFLWVDPRVMRGTLLAAITFVLFLFLEAAFLPLLVGPLRTARAPVLVLTGFVTLVLGYLLWRALRELQRALTGLVRASLASAGSERDSTGETAILSASLVPQRRDGAAPAPPARVHYRTMIEQLRVAQASEVAGRLLIDSGIRERTGVTVLGIERDGVWIGNPGPGVILEVGDDLIVIGSEEQRQRAERLVTASAAEPRR